MLFGSGTLHFASNREDCNNMGKKEALLGYNLKE
jgi:hypothetical protein